MRSKYIFLHVDSQFMCQSLNLSWIKVVQNAGCVFVYICGGYKNNFQLQFGSFFKVGLPSLPIYRMVF